MATNLLSRRVLLVLPAMAFGSFAQPPESKLVVVLIGPPGSGKSTQARFLKSRYGIPAVDFADLLKKIVGKKTSEGRALAAAVASGDLVNDQAVNDMIVDRIAKKDCARGFVLDGYPRSASQAQFIEQHLKDLGFPAPKVVSLEVTDADALKRMSGRGRADDKPEYMTRRLDDYRKEVGAIVEYYSSRGLIRIDGSKPALDVSQQIEAALGPPAPRK